MATPLIDKGHKVTILMQDSGVNREKVMLECPEASICWHPSGLSPFKERRLKQASLKQLQPDLVWVCAVGLRNWMFRPKQSTVMLADHSELPSRIGFNYFRRIIHWFIEWGHVLFFDVHVCASRYLEQFYERRLRLLGKGNRVHYSPYAYHPKMMQMDISGSEKLRKRWDGRKAIIYMGSFWENYGFWDMLHAFKTLAQKRDDFVAVFIGRGPEKDKGIDWIKTNGLEEVIHVEGYVAEEDLPAYFTAAFAFLSPMRDTVQDWARCPSKLFMYIPYKRPIVTCEIGEAKELLDSNGYYFAPGNSDSLINALEQVLDLADCSSSVVPEEHTYKARVDAFLNWYEGWQ